MNVTKLTLHVDGGPAIEFGPGTLTWKPKPRTARIIARHKVANYHDRRRSHVAMYRGKSTHMTARWRSFGRLTRRRHLRASHIAKLRNTA